MTRAKRISLRVTHDQLITLGAAIYLWIEVKNKNGYAQKHKQEADSYHMLLGKIEKALMGEADNDPG